MPHVLTPAVMLAATLLVGCGDNERVKGELVIATSYGPVNNCPDISWALAAPMQTSIGGTIAVSASASGPEPSDVVGYSWSPPEAFADPTSASTSYLCASVGLKTLTLAVSDHHRSPCTVTTTLQVTCVAGKSAPGL